MNQFQNCFKNVFSYYYFKVALLFCVIITTPVHGDGEHNNVPKTRIALVNLDSGFTIRTITDKSNHEVILTTPTSYRESYLFECNASYPVEWNYFGEGVS